MNCSSKHRNQFMVNNLVMVLILNWYIRSLEQHKPHIFEYLKLSIDMKVLHCLLNISKWDNTLRLQSYKTFKLAIYYWIEFINNWKALFQVQTTKTEVSFFGTFSTVSEIYLVCLIIQVSRTQCESIQKAYVEKIRDAKFSPYPISVLWYMKKGLVSPLHL